MNKKISEFCKRVREEEQLSQNAFAKNSGLTHTTINKFESGFYDLNPSPLIVSRLIDIYGFNIDDAKEYGINIDDEFQTKLNQLRLKKYKGTPSIINDILIDTFIKKFIFDSLNREYDYSFIDDNNQILAINDNRHYSLELTKENSNGEYLGNCYVYFILKVSTINSIKDKTNLINIINTIFYQSIIETKPINGLTNEIHIVTGSTKIFEFICNYFKSLNYLSGIDYIVDYCPYGSYSGEIISKKIL